jgi:TonB family protein
MKAYKQISSLLCGALLASNATAQEPAPSPDQRDNTYIQAAALKRMAPSYPQAALSAGREGWVTLSFVISEEGKVIEPMIEDSSNRVFDASALQAVESWTYIPATVGGKPVEQSMVKTTIRYQLEDGRGARPQFIRKYRSIRDLILAHEFPEAGRSLEELEHGTLNYYEDAWLWWLKYVYLEASGTTDPDARMVALRKALGSTETEDDNYLESDVFVSASQNLYVLRVRSGDFSGAISVFERLKASKSAQRSKLYKDVVGALEPTYQQMMNAVAGPNVLRQKATVDEHNYWFHRMLRRSFSFGDVRNGNLDIVDLRCTRANRRLTSLPADAVLKIPDDWGDCSVYIKGDPGTTFSYEEYAADAANTIDPSAIAPKTE